MSISLRKVGDSDWDFILSLRNNESFRDNFLDQHTISKQEHYDYLNKQKSNQNFFNWIILYDNQDVGYVRILDNDISIIIDEKFHGKGIGTYAIKLLEKEAKLLGIKRLVGKMMFENKGSEHIFRNNDFELKMLWFEKDLN